MNTLEKYQAREIARLGNGLRSMAAIIKEHGDTEGREKLRTLVDAMFAEVLSDMQDALKEKKGNSL